MCQREAVESALEFRRLGRTELSRVAEIDRTERIDVLYDQHGTQLVEQYGNFSAPAWDPDGHGEHSVEAQVRALEYHVPKLARTEFSGEVEHTVPQIRRLVYVRSDGEASESPRVINGEAVTIEGS